MATTPSPLPIPQPVAADNPLAQSLLAISRAVPNIDPEVATGIGQASVQDPAAAVTAAQGAQGYVVAGNTAQYLREQNATNQLAAWKQLPATEQAMVMASGYRPPHPHRSLWGRITHDIGQGVHDVLNAAGSGLRLRQHLERTLFASDQTATGPTWGAFLHTLHSASDWSRAWNETSNGEHYILPSVQRQVRDQYGDQTFQLAMKLATGSQLTQIVSGAPPEQQQQLAQQIMSDPKLHEATALLQAGHVSEGRMLLGAGFIAHHPVLGNTLSGLVDGTLDWYGDPMVVGAKAAQAASVARYLVRNADDVYRIYGQNQQVKTAFGEIASHIQAGDYVGLFQRYPKLAGMADSFRAAQPNIHGADDVADFFADNANLQAVIAGHPASLPGHIDGGVLPHLSFAGQARLAVKGELQKSIDWLADRPATLEGLQPGDIIDHPLTAGLGPVTRIETAGGQLVRRLLTLTPTGDEFDASSPNWFNKLRDLAMISLPRARANRLLNEYAQAATLAQRKQIYAGLLKEVMTAMGIDRIPGVTEWADSVTNPEAAESILSHQAYAPEGADLVWRDGNQRPVGILKSDMTDVWKMPNFRILYAQSKKLAIARAANGAINNQMVDRFMNEAWKPLALARFGFAVRVAGEEAFGMLLRANPAAYVQARAAGSMLRQQTLAGDPELHGRLAATWGWLTAHLPQAARDRIKTPTDLIVEHMGDATSRAMAKVAGALAGDRYRQAVRLMAEHGILDADGAFGRYASASESHGGRFYDQFMGGLPTRRFVHHGRLVTMRLAPSGTFVNYEPKAEPYINSWYTRLHAIANDPWARAALEARTLPASERLQNVAAVLKDDPAWLRAERSLATTDGRYVATGEATVDAAALDHAKTIIDLVDGMTHSAAGEDILGLADHLLTNRRPPTTAALDTIPEEDRPASVTGPEYLAVGTGSDMWNRGVNRMFSIIGRQIDWISRQPMFIHNFTISLDAFGPLVRTWEQMGLPAKEVEQRLAEAATDRALHLTIPFIHNPQVRSQFEVVTRNVAPFMFAQVQFYKRWARTMAYSPWAFRQAQLISQGVAHSGFTHTDPTTGQQYFVYPGAGVVQDVIAKTLGVFGFKAWLPIEANLRGQVKMASPGLERIGLPSLGPAVVVPLKFIEGIFPEVRGPAQAIEGQQTASQSYISSLVPTTVARIWQDFTSSPNNSQQFASAMMQAIQFLEASGHGIGTVATTALGTYNGIGAPPKSVTASVDLKPGDYVTDRAGKEWVVQADGEFRRNDPAELAAYMHRVQNWTRVFLITRTIFGFNAPASPEALFDPGHVNEDFQALLKTLPYQEAVLTFMKIHPDASAYTVFQTKNQAGAPLPATAASMGFMDANQGFFGDHKLAGAFFIPTQDSTGKFDVQAYRNQLTEQLRVRRTPAEFWQEIAYTTAASTYFAAENRKNAMLQGGFANRRAIDQAWTVQSQEFMQANPLFAQQLADSGSQYTRANIEQDLAAALADPRLPETPQTEDVRQLFNAWVLYQAVTAPYGAPGGNTYSGLQKYQMEVDFAGQAEVFLRDHPDAQPVFDRLMRPTLSAVLTTQAQAA